MRILIATLTVGGGHLAAAAALEEAWRKIRPADTVERVDLMQFFSPLHRKLYTDGWVHITTHAPELWGLVFDRTDDPDVARRLRRTRRLFPSSSRRRFRNFVAEFQPDVVLCTHYLPVEVLGAAENEEPNTRSFAGDSRSTTRRAHDEPDTTRPWTSSFVVSVVTDFEVHAVWMAPAVGLYCVAAEESRTRLVARGVHPDIIVATGIPISLKFCTRVNPRAVHKALGVRSDIPFVLVLSGGFGMGPVEKVLDELDMVQKPIQVIVVCGRNEKLRSKLAGREYIHPTRVLGFVSNMHELMAASDLIITKPGGLTVSEALAVGRPILIVSPIPGQESANSDFLLSHGAAVKANRIEDISMHVQNLLGSRKLAALRRAARKLGRPNAAQAICQEVLRRLSDSLATQDS